MIEWLRASAKDPEIALGTRVLPVEIVRNARARRLTMRLAADGSAVRITLPRWCRSAEAMAFAEARKGWLEAQLAKVPERVDPVVRGWIRYRGEQLPLAWREKAPRTPRLGDHALELGGPEETRSRRIERWLRAEALRLISADLEDYAALAGVALPQLRLTGAGRRWGSCSTSGIVRVNWRLVMAPDAVRRSVVAHEVAHLVHFDHSPAFHACLAGLYEGDIADADRWLREHGRALYAEFG